MDEATRKRLFEPSSPRSRSTGNRSGPFGLVFHHHENHGGTLTVSSAKDQGTVFVIRLPLGGEGALVRG